MHREFCTLLDSNYLFKAVAMHRSLLRHCPDFHLTVFCFDELVEEMFEQLDLPHLSTVSLAALESHDPELLSVKGDRTPVEYCWTSTPALPLYVFANRPEVEEVTYIDADLLFFSDPEPLFEEMGDASVLITPHRYAPEYERFSHAGIYNVQFLVFRRDARGLEALQWWHDRCIEWCYFRYEDGKIGDQGYLDDWPERFPGVHVLEHVGGGLAPWNITQYEVLGDADGGVSVDGRELIFFHYHGLTLLTRDRYDLRPPVYEIPVRQEKLVYGPYLDALRDAKREVRSVRRGFAAGIERRTPVRDRIGATGEDVVATGRRVADGAVRRFPFLTRVRQAVARRAPKA